MSDNKLGQHRLLGRQLCKRLLGWSSVAALLLRAMPAPAQTNPLVPVSGGAPAPTAPSSNSAQSSPSESLHCEVNIPAVQSPLPANALGVIDAATGAIQDVADGRKLVLAAYNDDSSRIDSPSFYGVIHIVKWKDPTQAADNGAAGNNWTIDPSYEHWYVYHSKNWHQADFDTNNRIFGAKNIDVLFIQLNRPPDPYTVRYQAAVNNKLPANLSNGLALATLFTANGGGAPLTYAWGSCQIRGVHVPSDVTLQAQKVDPPQGAAGPSTFTKFGQTRKFDNEGRYWFDFSVGVPITKISQLSIDTTNNTVSAKSIDKTNIFGLLDLYYPKVDVKSTVRRWPNLVVGVAVAHQPLHKILLGAGFGPPFANLYVGCLFSKQASLQTLQNGAMATPAEVAADTKQQFSPQFAFGLNISVNGVKQLLNAGKN